MDFVDWCTHVWHAVLEMSNDPQARSVGIIIYSIAGVIPPTDDGVWVGVEHVNTALMALSSEGLVEIRSGAIWRVTQQGRIFGADLIPLWQKICATPLDEQSTAVVTTASRLDVLGGVVLFSDIAKELGSQYDNAFLFGIVRDLEQTGMADGPRAFGDYSLRLTYRGLVWATRRDLTIESLAIDRLIAEWETTSVDFKRELHTDTKDQKAELIKDLIGLANTQTSGKRLLIVGFDDTIRTYFGAPDKKVTQNHLEQLIASYIEPNLTVSWRIVRYHGGDVGVLEVIREAHKLPYRAAASIGDKTTKKRIIAGQCFVRHGSQTEEPTEAELAAIEQESERAQRQVEEQH